MWRHARMLVLEDKGLLIKTWHKAKFCSKWSQMASVYGESMFHRQQRGLMI